MQSALDRCFIQMIGENIRNDIRRMIKNVRPFFGAQHMPHIKGLPTFEPPGIICIDWEIWWGVSCLTNLLRASSNVSKGATFVKSPAIDMISVMQLVKNFEPVV